MNLLQFVLFYGLVCACAAEKIVIIGAGVSGIAAAAKLFAKGERDVVILEAQQTLGGRIRTIKEGSSIIEYGAEWIMGEKGNILFDMAQDKEVELIPLKTDSDVYVKANGENIVHVNEVWNKYMELQPKVRTSESVISDFFEQELEHIDGDKSVNRALFKYFFESITPVANWSNEIGNSFGSFDVINGNSAVGVAAGMSHLLNVVMQGIADSNNIDWKNIIHYGCEVQNIRWNSAKPVVEYRNNGNVETIEADTVICTVPLGVLKEKYQTMFTPSLPQNKILAIQTLAFPVVNKIFLTFEKEWWPKSANLHVIWTENDTKELKETDKWIKNIVGFFSNEKLPNTLVAWVVEENDALSENVNGDYSVFVEHLKSAFSKQGWEVTEPIAIVGTRWHGEPNFRGSYSYRGINAVKAGVNNDDLREPLVNADGKKTIFFAGEATHSTHYATLHGAVESGRAVAMEVLSL